MPKLSAGQKDNQDKGLAAYHDAVKWLKDTYKKELDAKVKENRIALGLSAKPAGDSPERLKAKIARAEEQMRKWREELGEDE